MFKFVGGIFALVLLVFANYHIESMIDKKVSAQFNNKLNELDTHIISKLEKNNQALLVSLNNSTDYAQKIEKSYQWIKGVEASIQAQVAQPLVETGVIELTAKRHKNLNNPTGCEKPRGIQKLKIYFQKPYTSVPQVFTSLTVLDFGDGVDHRIKVTVNEVTKKYFEIDFNTWCDTKMSQAQASWLAIGL